MGQAMLDRRGGGKPLEIDGIIEEYYAYAGENISAGDFVKFIQGVAGQTSGTNTPNIFNSASVGYISSCKIDESRVLIAYRNESGGIYGTALIATISGATITYGSEYVFNNSGTTYISPCLVDVDKVLIAYINDAYKAYSIIGTINGTTITYGTPKVIGSGSSSYVDTYPKVVTLETNKVLMCWDYSRASSSTTYGLKACVLTISGTAIAKGTVNNIEGYQHIYLSLVKLSSTSAFLAYSSTNNSNYGRARVLTISGTTVTANTAYTFNTGTTYDTMSCLVDTNKVLIAYRDFNSSSYCAAIIATISSTVITFGNEYVFSSIGNPVIGGLSFIETNKALVLYQNSDNNYSLKSKILTISDSIITNFGIYEIPGSRGTGSSFNSTACLVDTNKVLIGYRNGNNSDYGTAGLLGIVGTTISSTIVTNTMETQVQKITSGQFNGISETDIVGGTSTEHNQKGNIIVSDLEVA